MFPVVILAGGKATRIWPLSIDKPKSLIEIAGKPFIFHQLEYLKKQGVKKILICIGNMGEKIKDTVGNGSRWGMNIIYSSDHPRLLGTGGALRLALPYLDEFFFIMYGDSYLKVDLIDIELKFKQSNKEGLMTIIKNNNKWDISNVNFYKNNIIKYSKVDITTDMEHIDYGLSILSRSVLNNYPNNHKFDLSQIFSDLVISNNLEGYEVFERFYEIGSLHGIMETDLYLRKS